MVNCVVCEIDVGREEKEGGERETHHPMMTAGASCAPGVDGGVDADDDGVGESAGRAEGKDDTGRARGRCLLNAERSDEGGGKVRDRHDLWDELELCETYRLMKANIGFEVCKMV
jgi:hypothetical protein